ncbi:MAG: hypothetical protein H6Q89_4857, partial [Myxococcaceae bacterium]|nr:hypothetical protein [Myxococcaceae bacterium]
GVRVHYTEGAADLRRQASLKGFTPEVFLVEGTTQTLLKPEKPWARSGDVQVGALTIPKVNDGDYLLRAKVKSPFGESSLDVPLPLYAPARVHVLTDRPLYEPGNLVKFRAVALKGSDLTPLDGRPGLWRVYDGQGVLLLEEKSAAGPWGVTSGTFPLDQGAESGSWRVEWHSGGAVGTRAFTVKPFTLPRFRVEASASKPFYRRGERPSLKGEVRYSSGAPVANAKLELQWDVGGEWPAPTAWLEGTALPKVASANASGHFTVELPAVPEDLQKQATLSAQISAIDSSGDRVEGSAAILLTEDPIAVAAVTELEGGLVQGFNNRLYLRATSADGQVLTGVHLTVKRLWEPTDKGVNAPVDEDGVATLQVDPGPPVNVVIRPQPFRPPPREDVVIRGELFNLLDPEESEPSLADRLAFDRLDGPLESCARFVDDHSGGQAHFGIRAGASGAIFAVAAPGNRLGRCVEGVVRNVKLAPGKERLFDVTWTFNDSDLPRVTASPEGVPQVPPALSEALADAMVTLRDCLPPTVSSGQLPKLLTWNKKAGSRTVELAWINNPTEARFADSAVACIQGRLPKLELRKLHPDEGEEGDEEAAVGFARLDVQAPEKYEAQRPQATTLVGYEFLITARKGDAVVGSTKLLMRPGAIPPLRLRVDSQLVKPGATVEVEVLRGPAYEGELPEKAQLTMGRELKEEKLDPKTRKVRFTLPTSFEGWASVSCGSGRVYLFVQPTAQLQVTVAAEKDRYAPGQLARLNIETRTGESAGPAAVGLFGVDESLGQLAPLPSSDELSTLRPQVAFTSGFPGLDAQALSMGRVRGKNATAATLLKVNALPSPAELEPSVALSGETLFDPLETLTDKFYLALEELHLQTRTWEASAPTAERMTPKTMARLWASSLDRLESKQQPAHDAWGRKLKLHRLPYDLLSLTDPRAVVVDGTRLPEDVENWTAWVAKEKP